MRGLSWLTGRRRGGEPEASLAAELLAHFPGAALWLDADGVIREAAPGLAACLGHAPEAVVGRRLTVLDEAPLDGELARGLARVAAHGTPWRGLVRCRHAEGHGRYLDVLIRPARPERGRPRLLAVMQDVDPLVAPARQDARRLRVLEDSLGRLPGAVFRLRQDARGRLRFDHLAGEVAALCDLDAEALVAAPRRLLTGAFEADREALSASLARSAVALAPWHEAFRWGAGERWLEVRARAWRDAEGETVWDGWLEDITERKRDEARLRRLITTDTLTGLLNRRGFMASGRAVLAHAARFRRPVAVTMLDLDHFKALNDAHGHAAGDIALQEFARLCRDCLRPYDLIARVGGEEFAAMLADGDAEEARQVFERLRRTVAEAEIVLGGETLHVTVSLGLAFVPPGGDLDEGLTRADRALYRAKQSGRNRLVGPAAAGE